MQEHVTVTAPQGKTATFEGFFDGERDRLFRALCLATRNRSEAEEVLQDAFLALWERWDRIGQIDDPQAYLYRTAMNLFISRRRRASRSIKRTLHLAPQADPMAEIDATDTVLRILAELTPKQRAIIVLTDVLDLPSDQAAAILGMKPGAVRTAASRARESLRNRIEVDRDD